jgi:hypothetical protein
VRTGKWGRVHEAKQFLARGKGTFFCYFFLCCGKCSLLNKYICSTGVQLALERSFVQNDF